MFEQRVTIKALMFSHFISSFGLMELHGGLGLSSHWCVVVCVDSVNNNDNVLGVPGKRIQMHPYLEHLTQSCITSILCNMFLLDVYVIHIIPSAAL